MSDITEYRERMRRKAAAARERRASKKAAAGPVKEKHGTLHTGKTMWLRQAIGTCKSGNGLEYDMDVNLGAYHPIIRSKKSGRWWTINWEQLVRMAIAAGIDEPESTQKT